MNFVIDSATASTGGDASAYFQIDPATGEISLRQGLNLDTNAPSSYTVSAILDFNGNWELLSVCMFIVLNTR